MEIRFIPHQDIDMQKWDNCIANAVNSLPYSWSWYLDTVCYGWDALVGDDYKAVFPLTGRKKAGIKYLFQPPFTQQLGLFSGELITDELLNKFLKAIPEEYRLVEINLNKLNLPDRSAFTIKDNLNLELELIAPYEDIRKAYSKNLRRNLKKAGKSQLAVMTGVNPTEVIRLFRMNRGRDIRNLTDDDYIKLEQLIYKMSRKGFAEVRGVFTERNSLCAAAVFIKTPDRIIFLFSGLNEEGRQVSAMPWLINDLIMSYSGKNLIFDFEGSNDKNLARFYKSFGAVESWYPALKINRLKWWQKLPVYTVKKLR